MKSDNCCSFITPEGEICGLPVEKIVLDLSSGRSKAFCSFHAVQAVIKLGSVEAA